MIDVTEHLGLVGDVISKYKYKPPYGMDEDDLYQVGCIGLMKAAKKYRPESGEAFSTVAFLWIRSELSSLYDHSNRAKRQAKVIDLYTQTTENGAILAEIIPDNKRFEDDVAVRETIEKLTNKEPVIVSLMAQGYTQLEVAKVLGITHQRVSQRVKKLRRGVV